MKNKLYVILLVIFIICFFVINIFYIVKNNNDIDVENKNVYSEIDYTIPKEFEKDSESYYTRNYSYNKDRVYCYLNIFANEKGYYDDVITWFKDNINHNLNAIVSEIKEVNLNNTQAFYIDIKTNGDMNYYYGMESNNYYYMIRFYKYDYTNGDRNDLNTNLCDTALDSIVSSIKLK